MFKTAPGARLRCRVFRWGNPSKKISRKLELGGAKVYAPNDSLMSGGKGGPVLALLCTQTRDLDGNHGVSRGDVVRAGAGSDKDASRPLSNADPICGGAVGSSGGA